MRIVQFLHGNKIGGMEKFCLDLSNALSLEHNVMLIADPVFKLYCKESISFIELDVEKSRNNPFFLFSLYKSIKAFHPDIIHVNKQNSIQIIKRLSPFLKVPFVATKHDTQKKKSFYGLGYVISISNETTKTIKAKKIFKIYNGIPYVEPEEIEMSKAFNIVAIGGLRKVKGYDRLIKAVSKLPFDFHVTIIGEGSERVSLEKLIVQHSLEGKVSLVGFKENVQDYLYSSDLQIISSVLEGFSLSMVEGIFYAPILISTKVSGCIEVLSDDLLYDVKDLSTKIMDISENYDKYSNIFQTIKKRYTEHLTINVCAKEHERVYEDIIKDFYA